MIAFFIGIICGITLMSVFDIANAFLDKRYDKKQLDGQIQTLKDLLRVEREERFKASLKRDSEEDIDLDEYYEKVKNS